MPHEKSLAPFGNTLPGSKRRLMNPTGPDDAETIMMKLWGKENLPETHRLFGTPLRAILLLRKNGGFSGRVSARDRKVVAATVQWFATNVGRALHEEFRNQLEKAYRKRHL